MKCYCVEGIKRCQPCVEKRDAMVSPIVTPLIVTESVKYDQDKYDPTMLTVEMIEAVSKVRMYGAKKYGRDNFRKTGFKYTRSLAAVLRHCFAILSGEWLDPESGLPHAAHAICGLEHLIYDSIHHPENNDITKKK